jgi:DNA-binding transcriptional MerR regulator
VCLRNIRISTTLLKSAAEEGLTLEQIGQILCRPDEDDSMPSLLEKIVQKARQITDMMIKMQMKYKDSKLRAINKGLNGDIKTMEEIKLGDTDFKRSRVNSNYQNGPTRSRDL